MKLVKLLPVVAAVAALSASTGALAWNNGNGNGNSSNPYTETVNNTITNSANVDLSKTDETTALFDITSCINIYGQIDVNEQAIALTDAKQDLNGNTFENDNLYNNASVSSSFEEASGIAGVNVGTGEGFAQDNKVSVASLNNSYNSAASLDAETFLYQGIGSNITITDENTNNNASMSNSDFDSYNGIADVNVGAGTSFEQSNDVALAEGSGVVANSTATDTQSISGLNESNNCNNNTASINSYDFNHASGVQNVNVGSGSGFMQANSVAISSASLGVH